MVCTLIICALRRLRQENCKSQASLGYTGRPCLKEEKTVHSRYVHINMERHSVLITSRLHNIVV